MIALNCDFCGKAGIEISKANILYCGYCHKSFGKKVRENE